MFRCREKWGGTRRVGPKSGSRVLFHPGTRWLYWKDVKRGGECYLKSLFSTVMEVPVYARVLYYIQFVTWRVCEKCLPFTRVDSSVSYRPVSDCVDLIPPYLSWLERIPFITGTPKTIVGGSSSGVDPSRTETPWLCLNRGTPNGSKHGQSTITFLRSVTFQILSR